MSERDLSVQCGALLCILQVVHHELVHFGIDLSPFIEPIPFFVKISDYDLIFVIKTYSTNSDAPIIAILSCDSVVILCFGLLLDIAIEIDCWCKDMWICWHVGTQRAASEKHKTTDTIQCDAGGNIRP